jgi:hypothetical protein
MHPQGRGGSSDRVVFATTPIFSKVWRSGAPPGRRKTANDFRRGVPVVRRLKSIAVLLVLAIILAVGYRLITNGGKIVGEPDGCTARAGGRSAHLDIDQAENAVIIAAVAGQRGLPPRAVSIAYATALQESKLRNLDHGDRDSLGLFQQRPSQGWGTASQIRDPYYASGKFFDALVKIHGYQNKDLGKVAQAIQHSGYPDAYDDHVPDGRTLASAITGETAASFTCEVHVDTPHREQVHAGQLTPRAGAVKAALTRPYGSVVQVQSSGGVRLGLIGYPGQQPARLWAVANYLMANAKRLDLASIRYGTRVWRTGDKSIDGWTHGSAAPPRTVFVTVLN